MRHAEVAFDTARCQIPAAAMAIAVPDAAPKLVSKGTQTLRGNSNRPTLTARQALANQSHSIRCAGTDSAAHGKPLLQPKHGFTSRQESVTARANKTTQQKRQSNTSSAWSQNEDPNLPDVSLGSQVPYRVGHIGRS
ncbi:hypothetical protein ABBQ32_005212 [Trebouxia sp. C0010 RCD-2024]